MIKAIDLPETIKVTITKLPKGKYLAELASYGVFTEADNSESLSDLINDLIYTYFDIPKNLQREFFYKPKENHDHSDIWPFVIYSTPEFSRKYLHS